MVPIARRTLLQDRLRLGLAAGGVALATMLVALLGGLQAGVDRQLTTYVDHAPADLYLAQRGVRTFQASGSAVPLAWAGAARGVPGVRAAAPLLALYSILDLHGRKVPAFVLGYVPATFGGPWRLAAGRAPTSSDEAVVDRVLARQHGLALGDQVEILGRQWRIIGLSAETSSWMMGLIFVPHGALASALGQQSMTSFVLIQRNPEDPAGEIAALRVQLTAQFPDAVVLTPSELVAADRAYVGGVFTVPLRLMVGIAVGVGALLVGLTIYSITVEREREYGVLKALGMRNARLYQVVGEQALVAAALGLGGGLVLAAGVAALIEWRWPQFEVALTPAAIAQAVVGALAMALLAAYVPARRVAGLDPARVFRR